MKLWKSIWNFSQLEVVTILPEKAKEPREVGRDVVELAKAFKKYRSEQELFLLIGSISSLLDILNLPLVELGEIPISFIGIFKELLDLIVRKNSKEPALEICVALASQTAYLESLRLFLKVNFKKEKTDMTAFASAAVLKQIIDLGEKLELDDREFELDFSEARETVACFRESKLAKVFERLTIARLQDSGIELQKATTIAQRVSGNTHRYLKQGFIEAKNLVPALIASYGNSWQRDWEASRHLEKYLENVVKRKAEEPIFAENFSFKDIYIPLDIKPVKKDSTLNHLAKAQNIENWVQTQLQNDHKQEQVLFIQAEPGRGKSVFCRIFADWVRRELHPIWTPILICLADLKNIGRDFHETIIAAIDRGLVARDNTWLRNPNVRFLFILDGLDEAILERGFTHDLEIFLEQVIEFQKSYSDKLDRHHRVLMTGRPLAIERIKPSICANLKRVEILPLDDRWLDRWLERWQALADIDPKMTRSQANQFREIFQDPRFVREIEGLADEPLLLYLLATLHRDGYLKVETAKDIDKNKLKISLYEQAIAAALDADRKSPQDLEKSLNILAEAGLCVIQSGREYAPVSTLDRRLQEREDEEANILIAKARQLEFHQLSYNSIAIFALKSVNNADNSIEFFHKSFAEFFFAKRIIKSFEEWTSSGLWQNKYAVSSKQLEWDIYDLFGYGNLTLEVLEYAMAFLAKSRVDIKILLERLNNFYLSWSEGKFIEATEEMLPLKKARQLRTQWNERGQREIDLYTGLNVSILLLELHRYFRSKEHSKDKISFHPCGRSATDSFDPQRLLRVINYSKSIVPRGFNRKIGRFFKNAELNEADLKGVDLSGADFSGAYLSGTDLKRADLRDANFSGADLSGADLSDSILRGANLTRAILKGTDLTRADLSGAKLNEALLVSASLVAADLSGADLKEALLSNSDLSGTDLSGADFRGTHLKDLNWDSETNWTSAIGLKTVLKRPDASENE